MADQDQALAALLPGIVADEVVARLAGSTPARTQRSAEQGNLVKALCAARKGFSAVETSRTAKVQPKAKDGREMQPYSYSYATLADAIDATAEALAEHGLALFQDFEQVRGGIEIRTELVHESGEWRLARLAMPLQQDAGPQQIGSAITYGRRYSLFAMLNLAPETDDDGKGAQDSGGRTARAQASTEDMEALLAAAAADPRAAFAGARKVVESVAGCGDISEPRLIRLRAIADKSGWGPADLGRACQDLLGVAPERIPYKAYDLVVELFRNVRPAAFRPAGNGAGSAPGTPAGSAQAAPQEPMQPKPRTWRDTWDEVKKMSDALPTDRPRITPGALAGVIEALAAGGWSQSQVDSVLTAELGYDSSALPPDGTNPPVFRAVAKAFRSFKPEDQPEQGEQEAPFGDNARSRTPNEILAAAREVPPVSKHEAWTRVAEAAAAMRAECPHALQAVTSPDFRLALFNPKNNGGRSSGDVAGLVQNYLGIDVAALPAALADLVSEALQAFPVDKPHGEEILLRMPKGGEKPAQLGELLRSLVDGGLITEEEVPHTGEEGKATKRDVLQVIEIVRGRVTGAAR